MWLCSCLLEQLGEHWVSVASLTIPIACGSVCRPGVSRSVCLSVCVSVFVQTVLWSSHLCECGVTIGNTGRGFPLEGASLGGSSSEPAAAAETDEGCVDTEQAQVQSAS